MLCHSSCKTEQDMTKDLYQCTATHYWFTFPQLQEIASYDVNDDFQILSTSCVEWHCLLQKGVFNWF